MHLHFYWLRKNISKLEILQKMTLAISILLFLIFLFLSSIHVYWGFGGKWGKDAAIPAKENNSKVISPGPLPTFIVALGLLAFGVFILIKSKFLNVPISHLIEKPGLWFIAILFLLRAIGEFKYVGIFKKIRHTEFAQNDTKYYTPLCLVIAILTIVLELNN